MNFLTAKDIHYEINQKLKKYNLKVIKVNIEFVEKFDTKKIEKPGFYHDILQNLKLDPD